LITMLLDNKISKTAPPPPQKSLVFVHTIKDTKTT
jgi:hypothetical protein